MAAQSVTTIIFDLSEVLIRGLCGIDTSLAHYMGIEPDGLYSAFGGQPLTDLFCGRMTEDEYVAQLLSKQGWNITTDGLKLLIRQNFHQRIPGMERMIANLSCGYKLALLSDHANEWINYIKAIHPFLNTFRHQFYSFQLGQTKTEISTFSKVLNALEQNPEQCLFIDDSKENITTAEKSGIQSIRFFSSDDLRVQLREKGLHIRNISRSDDQESKNE